jgi:hypothetical protein
MMGTHSVGFDDERYDIYRPEYEILKYEPF